MKKMLSVFMAGIFLLLVSLGAAESMNDAASDEIAITVGGEIITAAELKNEIRLELIRSALDCAENGYEYNIVDPENIYDRADIVAFDLEMRTVTRQQAEKLGVGKLIPESEDAVKKEVQEAWNRYVSIAYSDNGMAFLPAGDYEMIDGDPDGNIERYFASFGLTKEALRRIITAEYIDYQLDVAVTAGKDLKTRDESINYYTDWILERYDEAAPIRNENVIGRVIEELGEEDEPEGISGTWYEEELLMTISHEGRFVLKWNDGDWTGSLKSVQRTNDEGDDYTAYLITLDRPEITSWKNMELIPDIYHPGKMFFYEDGSLYYTFYNVPVYVMDMQEEDPANYEPYIFIDQTEGEEPAVTMMFTFLRPVTDAAVMVLYDQRIDEEGEFHYGGDTLEWWGQLDSQTRIIVKHVFEGDLPDLAVNFIGEDEKPYNFAVQLSGYDGEPELIPLPPIDG